MYNYANKGTNKLAEQFQCGKKKKIRINIDSFIRIIKSRVSLDKFESTQRAHIIAKAIVNKN